ncbi:eukaryotic translation initiation factor 3 subunit H-like [Corticium candelabrum]|uniref:eukaryotic translation initiation factor 3 subunit H-like n=1 Tax=Corticium candelabrum TaxID=121492 RepID=UPI002E253CA1|nr:eukaryotic translation initiation factor 3 subunit H-like [Corticium candelabrum]
MAASAASSSATAVRAQPLAIEKVHIDGLVVLKIIQHCEQEGGGAEAVQGNLLGLVDEGNKRVEITNCFPTPQRGDEEEEDSGQLQEYQIEMMRLMREVNIDYMLVGWYQSTFVRSSLNRTLVESQFTYQKAIEASIVLLYDPVRTSQGCLSLKAYRLSEAAIEMCKENWDYSVDLLNKLDVAHGEILQEVPIVIHNSHLINILSCQLGAQNPEPELVDFLSLGTSVELEKNVRLLMSAIDDVGGDASKFSNYQRLVAKHQQFVQQSIQKRQQENALRSARNEDPLPEEDFSKVKVPQCPTRLESLLLGKQIGEYCEDITHFAGQSMAKLFLARSLQDQ